MGFFDFLKNKQKEESEEFRDKRKAECPNCHKELEKIPGAKTKCPHCGEFMYVRTRPDNTRVVITQEEKEDIDFNWGEKTKVNRFLRLVNTTEITEKEVFERRQKSHSLRDAFWSLCNEYLLKNKKDNNIDNIISLYYAMEDIRESEGKNANHIVKKRVKHQLLRQKSNGISIVIPICTDNPCRACKEIDGKEFTIDEALENPPIPPDDCENLRCSCVI